jgi:hypothetical protein
MNKIIIALIFIFIFFIGCRNFDIVNIEGQPDECNDFYTVMKYYAAAGQGDSAFVGTVYNECRTARAEIRQQVKEKHCKAMIYGEAGLDKTQYKKYADYLECIK